MNGKSVLGDGKSFIAQYLLQMSSLLMECPVGSLEGLIDVLRSAREEGRKVFTFGNGGSAAAASHLACDLAKGTINGAGKRFRVICLSDNLPLITAWANDSDYTAVFVEQLDPLLETDDVVIGISGSGNSRNVIRAIDLAKARGGFTVGLTGFDGGELAQRASLAFIVPSSNMQQIEDVHMVIIHLVTSFLRDTSPKDKEVERLVAGVLSPK